MVTQGELYINVHDPGRRRGLPRSAGAQRIVDSAIGFAFAGDT